jgi:hypothetical protein
VSKQLSEQETAVLRIILDATHPRSDAGATGDHIAQRLNSDPLVVRSSSPAGAHQTAASLCRKKLAYRAGTSKLQWYRITQMGRDALDGKAGEWRAR